MRTAYIIIFLLCVNVLSAQSKQDYYWPFGKDQNIKEDGVQAFAFDFSEKPFDPILRPGELNFDQNNASICDKDGNLLFYTNGCAIANRLHQIMPNGDSINTGPLFMEFWGGDCGKGYPGPQNITILPDPGNGNCFYVIHKPISYNPNAQSEFRFTIDSIKYSYVDMTLDNGYGDVTAKNVNFDERQYSSNYLTPISQSNGQDWWIINPVFPEGFAVYSLTQTGLIFEKLEPSPIWDPINTSASGHARISPDGQRYALFNLYDGLYLSDLDRDDATMTNEKFLEFPIANIGTFSTCEWSPNSRFLYLAKRDTLWQLDTHAEPLSEGLVFIGERDDDHPDSTGRSFGVAALGPDCRLYIRSKSGSLTFHVIHKPDEPGLACDFVTHGLDLPSYSASGSFPNFPRFRVDEEEKWDPSITSMFGDEIFWRRDMTVFPNPARDQITVELPELKTRGQIFIVDMLGQVALVREAFGSGQMAVDISVIPAGRYSVEYVPEDNAERVVYTAALIISE